MQNLESISKQKGATLIIMAFIIGFAVIAYLLHALDPQRLRLEQDKKTMQTLNEAKQALIAWAVSHPVHPGQLPFPDRLELVNPNYDGYSDCPPVGAAFLDPSSYSLLLGQLPVFGQTSPCVTPLIGLGENFQDAQGNRFWYAVSRNLIYDYQYDEAPVINPGFINPNPATGLYDVPPYLRQAGTTAYPWLKVLDRNGVLISDKVAAVIIAPGNPIGGQNRVALSPASEFLDGFKIGGNIYRNSDYNKPDEDFIVGEDSRSVSSADTTFVQPYNFNDKLVYVTIDELIAALNSRAATEASSFLKSYKSKTGQFPYAANLGVGLNSNISSPPNQQGALPIDVTDTCTCTTFQSCSCSFKPIISVTFTKNSGTWQSSTLGCSRSGNKCTCTAAGSCTRNTINFTCNSAGTCTTTQTGVNLFTYNIPSYADALPDYTGCFLSGSNPACNSAGTFGIGLKEATWFKNNFWQDYFYYEWSSIANLQAGGKTGISALLVATGKAIVNPPFTVKSTPQVRPSNNIFDYLDSAENTNGNPIFDATNKQKTSNYNDQAYIVAP